jgi:hypothetical protein
MYIVNYTMYIENKLYLSLFAIYHITKVNFYDQCNPLQFCICKMIIGICEEREREKACTENTETEQNDGDGK